MHPVYLSLGNIHKSFRRKRNSRAWLLLAKLPTGQFHRTEFGPGKVKIEKMPGIHEMVGPDAKLRRCITVLMAWIADLEEQLMIAGVASFHCPICFATKADLGDPNCFHCRTGQWMVETLANVRATYPNATTYEFRSAVKSLGLGLSGCIEVPCWEGLLLGPERFIKQDATAPNHRSMGSVTS